MKSQLGAAIMMAGALVIAGARADHFTLTRFADNTTPVPGKPITFSDFSLIPPSIHRESIVFQSISGGIATYLYRDGQITRIYDDSSTVYMRDAGVALVGYVNGQIAVRMGAGFDSLQTVVRANETTVPGSTSVIKSLMHVGFDGSNLAFAVASYSYYDNGNLTNYTNADGVYTLVDGVLTRIIDRNTPVPGFDATFDNFEYAQIYGTNILFAGSGGLGNYGLYRVKAGGTEPIVTMQTAIPGTPATLAGLHGVSFREAGAGFIVITPGLDNLIASYYEDTLRVVASPGTASPIPGEVFAQFQEVSFDGGNMAFLARTGKLDTGQGGHDSLFTQIGGQFQRVVGIGDVVDGREVWQILFSDQGLSGNSVVFTVRFTDDTWALYRADLILDAAIPVTEDFDGGEKSNVSYYDSADGMWFVRRDDGSFKTRQFGFPGTQPVPGDYDNDGVADIAVYDPYYGTWYILASHDGFQVHQFGYYGAQPVQKDYDGDGRCDLGVYDALTGDWFIQRSTEGFLHLQFGFYGATPIPADFDDDSKTDIAVFEHARGNWYVLASTAGFSVRQFGYYGVTPVAVDFDGQGADYAVFDRNSGVWYTLGQVDGFQIRPFGYNGVLPVSADYDGDAKSDLGVYDPHRAVWYLLRTAAGFRFGGL